MANPTFFQLATTTVGSGGASSVTFSNIPQVYTDLLIKVSARDNFNSGQNENWFSLQFNGVTTSYSSIELTGNAGGTVASVSRGVLNSGIYTGDEPMATSTANTFSNKEFYIPNYTSSNYKSVSMDAVSENNGTLSGANGPKNTLLAALWSNTAPITSISFLDANASSFVQYSTFTLYGVRNY